MKIFEFWKKLLLGLVLTLLLIAYPHSAEASQCDSIEECTFLYNQAIVDAGSYEQSEIKPLTPIQKSRIAAVTWTSWSGYKIGPNTLGIDVWVTIVPQLKRRCQRFQGDDLTLRLEQLLGLPPNNGKTQFVEMRVKTADLFRPCPNPDIQATECPQSFPQDSDPDFIQWFANQSLDSYQIPGGYPWTHLGYTYDWNPDSSEVGLGEYVVRKGAVVKVTSIVPTAEYCSPK